MASRRGLHLDLEGEKINRNIRKEEKKVRENCGGEAEKELFYRWN